MQVESVLRPRPRYVALGTSIAVLLVLTAFFSWYAYSRYSATRSVVAELSRLRVKNTVAKPQKTTTLDPEISKRWRAMEGEIAFLWAPVFRALEEANNVDIELLEFAPDKVGKRVVLRGEAHDQAALTTYTAALAAQPVFRELYLAHQKTIHKQGMDVLSFEIRATISS